MGILVAFGVIAIAVTLTLLLDRNRVEEAPQDTSQTQTEPDPYAGWQTYRNDEFEFRYPENLFELKINYRGSDVGLEEIVNESIGGTEASPSGIYISVDNTDHQNIDEFFNEYKSTYTVVIDGPIQDLLSNIKKTEFVGYPAYSYRNNFGAGFIDIIIFLKDSMLFKISLSPFGSEVYKNGVHDQILSIFKFIE